MDVGRQYEDGPLAAPSAEWPLLEFKTVDEVVELFRDKPPHPPCAALREVMHGRTPEFQAGQTASERFAELATAVGFPVAPPELTHWHCREDQVLRVIWPYVGIVRPTRCGLSDGTPVFAFPLKLVTCPKCRELAEADAAKEA